MGLALLLLTVVTVGCGEGREAESGDADPSPRVLCLVKRTENVFCVRPNALAYVAARLKEDGRALGVRDLLRKAQDTHDLRLDESVWYACPTGGWQSHTPASPPVAHGEQIDLSDVDVTTLVGHCELSLDATLGMSSDRVGGYGGLVQATKVKMDQQVARCGSGADPRAASALSFLPGIKRIVDMTWGVIDRMAKVQRAKEDFKQGAKDRFEGEPPDPDKKSRNWDGSKTPYAQAYETADRVCKANPGSCPEVEDEPETEPESTVEPEPAPEPDSEEELAGESHQLVSGDCLDVAGCSSCASLKAEWERFKDECDKVEWTTYECKSFVYTANNCADPGQIYPDPEGGYECLGGVDEEEAARMAVKRRCEAQEKLADPGPDETFECRGLPTFITVEESLRLIRERMCAYAISDECFTEEIDFGIGSREIPPVPAPPVECRAW